VEFIFCLHIYFNKKKYFIPFFFIQRVRVPISVQSYSNNSFTLCYPHLIVEMILSPKHKMV